MFGYVQTDRMNLYVKDELLYKSLYCGICKSIGKCYGCLARLTTSFDMTFMSAVVHNFVGTDVKINKRRCVLHPFKKRPMIDDDEINRVISAVNIMLAYYKATDDVLDDGGFKKRFARRMLKKAYKRVNKNYAGLEDIVKTEYERLRNLEKQNCNSIDELSDCFGMMMQRLSAYILKDETTESFENMSYELGKWVYLIDALDDIERDYNKKKFNPFLVTDKKFESKKQFFEDNKEMIDDLMNATISELKRNFTLLDFKFDANLVCNIIFRGIDLKTKNILENY